MTTDVTLSVIKALCAADLVIDTVAYVDTVELVFFPRLPRVLYRRMKALNDGRLKPRRRKKQTRRYPKFGSVWVLRQPTREVLRYAAKLRRKQTGLFDVCRVDIAVDFICRTKRDAAEVDQFLQKHLRQKWHGKARMKIVGYSTYSRPATKARNYSHYSDKPSKVTGQPCAHLELRFRTVRKCREQGFGDLSVLANGMDVLPLLKRETCLELIVPKRFDRFLERSARAVKRANRRFDHWPVDDVREWLAVLFAHIMQNEQGTVEPGRVEGIHVQDAHDSFKKLRRTLVRMEWDEFTDPPQWMHRRVVNVPTPTPRHPPP